MIYLDYQATTPVAPEVLAAMTPWLADNFANPHSPSRAGREADAAIEVARNNVEAAIGLDGGRAAFTSGATEAINWALKGTAEQARGRRRTIVTIATEHAAVLDTCLWLERQGFPVVRLPVAADGIVDLAGLKRAVGADTLLVAAMLVNNEIGVIQPVADIARIAHAAGALMLCDAVQGLGRVPLTAGPDMVAVSAHKIHGPKGVGALWLRNGVAPDPLLHGGGQEGGLRSGTLSPALCVGFGAAARLASERRQADAEHVEQLWMTASSALSVEWRINGSITDRYRGNLNICWPGVDAVRIIADLRDVAVSLGSACASGSGRPSHVLRALGLTDRDARSSIRIGFGRYTDRTELLDAVIRIDGLGRQQQGLSG